MKPIPISSCHNCEPEVWEVEGDSKGTYKCDKCHAIITKILRRRSKDESTR